MSQAPVLSPEPMKTAQVEHSGWDTSHENDDFDYVPMSPWAPISLFLGICGASAFLNLFGIWVAFLGVIVGVAATLRIRGAQGAVKGTWLAVVGTLLSIAFLSGGSAAMAYAYQHEVPEGYRRTTFTTEIADKQFNMYGAGRRLHPDVAPLIGQKLYLKGYMYQTQKLEGLTEFVFLKDNGECCFGGTPKPYDMMMVYMKEGETTRAYEGSQIAVAGTLHANVAAAEEEPVYTITADIVKEAPTPF